MSEHLSPREAAPHQQDDRTADPVPIVTPPKEILTVQESAKYVRVSTSTIRRWLKDELPHFRAGSQIRIAKEDLVDFLRKGGSGHSL